jgi:predicted amidohydrolase YtcJ
MPPSEPAGDDRSERAELLLTGGTVRTGDPARPLAAAVAVGRGRVLDLDEDALARRGPLTVVVDLAGGALLPSFGDGHAHPLWGGVELALAPVRDCTSVEQVLEAVRRFAAEHPDHAWVLGGSYDPTLAPRGLFDARWLDRAVADRPVLLESSDHHCAWVNTEALRRAGITSATPDPPAGAVVRREDGEPLGTLVEWNAVDLVKRLVPPHGEDRRLAALAASTRLLAAAGVTWAQEAALDPADLPTYVDAAAAGLLSVRVNVALRAEPGRWRGQLPVFTDVRESVAGSPWVSAGTVKLFADGIVEAGSASLLEPYADAPHTCGLPVWAPTELTEAVTAFDAAGFQVHIHAIGDAGIRTALDAVEQAGRVNGPRDRRSVVAHTQVVDPADLPRFAALGVVANFEPLWACLEPGMLELTLPRLGPERARSQYPMRTLEASGARLSMGSDWPVSSMVPLEGLAVAVTRQTEAGEPAGGWLAHERLDPASALAAYSAGVAYQAFEDHEWGMVRPGMRADLVALDRDPLDVEPSRWPFLTVTGTWLAGDRTYGPS